MFYIVIQIYCKKSKVYFQIGISQEYPKNVPKMSSDFPTDEIYLCKIKKPCNFILQDFLHYHYGISENISEL